MSILNFANIYLLNITNIEFEYDPEFILAFLVQVIV